MKLAEYTIKQVGERTGLSVHVLRVWERRYGAVAPARTSSRRRLYTEEQVERLLLLKRLTQAGQAIGRIANYDTERLRTLASVEEGQAGVSGGDSAERRVETALSFIRGLDARGLELTLERALGDLGAQGVLVRVVAPLAGEVGRHWREGLLTAAHEHFATAVLRTYLAQLARPFGGVSAGPCLLVGTPAGQLHELGALLAAAYATSLGWQVIYLGASLPSSELAGAALQSRARALALSLVYPRDDERLEAEFRRLRSLLGETFPILVGGQAAGAYQAVFAALSVRRVETLEDLGRELEGLRTLPGQAL